MTSPPNFSLILANNRWINNNGTPTTYFFRLIENLFSAAGEGDPLYLDQLAALAFSQSQGVDYSNDVSQNETLQALASDPSARIQQLERQVADLHSMIFLMLAKNTSSIEASITNLAAYTLSKRP